jgi:hypothetical protein
MIRWEPTIERLQELLRYDEQDDKLYWRVHRGVRKCAGKEAGYTQAANGRTYVRVDGIVMPFREVVFALKNGRWPVNQKEYRK